jgi:hypothetical protein
LEDQALSGDAFVYLRNVPIGPRKMLESLAAFRVP